MIAVFINNNYFKRSNNNASNNRQNVHGLRVGCKSLPLKSVSEMRLRRLQDRGLRQKMPGTCWLQSAVDLQEAVCGPLLDGLD